MEESLHQTTYAYLNIVNIFRLYSIFCYTNRTIKYSLILQHDKLLKLHIGKLSKEGFQLVSGTNHFKFEAPDGKMRKADVLDAEGIKIIFLLNSYCC